MNEHPATATPAAAAFASALAEDREAERLRADLRSLRAELAPLRAEVSELRARHEREHSDVEDLRGLGLRSLLASIRGTKHDELRREESEAASARDAAVSGLARLRQLDERAEQLEQRVARLGDTAARREGAAQAYAEELRTSTHPVAPHVDEVLTRLATVRGQSEELEHVRAAGARAAAALDAARGHLSAAAGWSAYDTFAGGGMLASSVKHSHADDASRSIAAAQHALVEFAGSMRDHGAAAGLRADLGIGGGTRTLDVWFDNVVTDWRVRSRLEDAAAAVERASEAVREALGDTTVEAARLAQQADELRHRRDALIGVEETA
jgi:prefoldin subunit 5